MPAQSTQSLRPLKTIMNDLYWLWTNDKEKVNKTKLNKLLIDFEATLTANEKYRNVWCRTAIPFFGLVKPGYDHFRGVFPKEPPVVSAARSVVISTFMGLLSPLTIPACLYLAYDEHKEIREYEKLREELGGHEIADVEIVANENHRLSNLNPVT